MHPSSNPSRLEHSNSINHTGVMGIPVPSYNDQVPQLPNSDRNHTETGPSLEALSQLVQNAITASVQGVMEASRKQSPERERVKTNGETFKISFKEYLNTIPEFTGDLSENVIEWLEKLDQVMDRAHDNPNALQFILDTKFKLEAKN